jgi:hypothetical protein
VITREAAGLRQQSKTVSRVQAPSRRFTFKVPVVKYPRCRSSIIRKVHQ